nr:uncharacterized protein LOC109622675 [Aedes albopictus]
MPRRRTSARQEQGLSSTQNEETLMDGCQRSNATVQEKLLHPDELKHLIPEFREGAGVTKWLNTIEHYAELYGWQDRTVLLYASCRLAGAAREWYNGFRDVINTFEEFDRFIKKAFPDQRNEADIHQELQQAVKMSGESYENFVFRVNALGINGSVSNAAIIVYIIRGLSNDPIYDCLVSRRYGDIYELLEHIKWCETNLHFRRKKGTAVQLAEITKTQARTMSTKQTQQIVCYNCNEEGHKSIHCSKPQRIQRCTNCQRTGHTAAGCLKTTTLPVVAQPKPAVSRPSVNVIGYGEQYDDTERILNTDHDSRMKVNVICTWKRIEGVQCVGRFRKCGIRGKLAITTRRKVLLFPFEGK